MTCAYASPAINCTCPAPYTSSSDFAPTENCAELVGVNLVTAAFELSFSAFMLLAAIAMVCVRSSADVTRPGSARKNTVKALQHWIPFLAYAVLAMVTSAVAVAEPRSNVGYKVMFALTFYMQVELEVEFARRIGAKPGAVLFVRVVGAALVVYVFGMAGFSVGTSLVVVTPLASVLLVLGVGVIVGTSVWLEGKSALEATETANTFYMVNYFMVFRAAFLVATIMNLAGIPTTAGSSTAWANASWAGAAMFFGFGSFVRLLL